MIIAQRPFLKRDFINYPYAIVDTSTTSPNYFDITYCPDVIGGGKSLIKFKGNGQFLVRNSQVEVEVLDAAGNAVKTEITTFIDRFNNYFATIHVYDSTTEGIGRVSLVGAANNSLSGAVLGNESYNDLGYNVIWTKSIKILPFERNNSELVMNQAPTVTIDQIVTPLRINSLQVTSQQFTAVTSSQATLVTSNFKGFDKKDSNSTSTTDLRLQNIRINPNQESTTINSVDTTTRKPNADINGGYQVNEINTYNTLLKTSVPFFSSSYIGGFVQFYNSNYTLLPQTQSNAIVAKTNPYDQATTSGTQSVATQLASWKSNIVKVLDAYTAYLDQPVQINVDTTTDRGTTTTTHTYKQVTRFTASVVYTPNSETYITSSNVSQSYLQFTFTDLKPLAGDVYKIRAFYKRNSVSQDWTLLNDQIVKAPEYLTDASYPNQTSYARTVSDYLLLGYFTSQQIGSNNWSVYNDTITGFDTATASYTSTPLVDSIRLQSTSSYNKILTTKYYQNYVENRTFALSFNCVLEPYTKLDLYMSSDALATTLLDTTYQSRAFDRSKNLERGRYGSDYNKFGKYIGKIENNTTDTVNYGRVVFDFNTDNDGLGRPLIRCSATNTARTGSAYLSEISVKPQKLNGFTPEIVQFAIPTPSDYSSFLSESVDYKLEYFDYTGNQSEYVTYINSVPLNLTSTIPTNGCQSEVRSFDFTPYYYISASSTSTRVGTLSPSVGGAFTRPSASTYPNAGTGEFYPAFVAVPLLYYTLDGAAYSGLTAGGSNGAPVFSGVADDGNYAFWNMLRPWKQTAVTDPVSALYNSPSGSMAYSSSWFFQGFDRSDGKVTSSWRYVDDYVNKYNYSGTTPIATYVYGLARSSGSVGFDLAPYVSESCVGIDRADASGSYRDFQVAGATTAQKNEALRKRRLYWPINGPATSSFFTENGGIYNVKFRLKKQTNTTGNTWNFLPDSGSFLRVFIYDVASTFTEATRGTAGWYPPDTNIVKIGHAYSSGSVTTPTITWYDSATGYLYDEYDINLIQYGSPAQLVFEPSGDNQLYFGTLIDNISFCKIGVTHDPAFIKPIGVSNIYSISNTAQNNLPQR